MDLVDLYKRIRDVPRLLEILRSLARNGFGALVDVVRLEAVQVLDSFHLAQLNDVSVTKGPGRPGSVAAETLPREFLQGRGPPAVRLRNLFQDLGPTFIKLGQILSTRPDLIPREFQEELQLLYDDVAPFPFEDAKNQLETSLGKPLAELFSSFATEPLGTASIGQVYAATLRSGEDVVVKIQRPGVEKIISKDLEILFFIAQSLEKRIPQARLFNLCGIVSEFERAVRKELNYCYERRNGAALGHICQSVPGIVVPRMFKDYSTKTVLTMERMHGVKITRAAEVGSDGPTLARLALRAMLVMVFEHGVFHADPHPGNLFALPENRLALLDVGMVGRISESLRFQLADLLFALSEHDVEMVVDVLLQLGVRQVKIQRSELARDVAEIMEKIIGVPLDEVSFSEILSDLFDSSRRHSIIVPHELALMGKALMTVEGVGRELDPDLDLEREVAPYVERLIAMKYAPSRVLRLLLRRTQQWSRWSWELPERVMTTLEDLERGNLKIRVEQTDQLKFMRNLDLIAGKLAAGMISSALIVSSALVVIFTHSEVNVFGRSIKRYLGLLGYLAAAFFGVKISRQVVRGNDDKP